MSWVAIAIGGSSLVGAGASYLASNKQAESARQGLEFQQGVYGGQQRDLAPYKQAGAGALGQLSDLYNLGGQGGGGMNFDVFRNSPDYKFAFDEGTRARENSAAAKGGLLSGNFARDITQYGQGAASQYLVNYVNRLMGISNLGGEAALGGGRLAGQMGGQIAGAYGNLGQAQASGIVGGANAINSAAQNYLTYSSAQNYYDALKNRNQTSYQPNYGLPSSGALPRTDINYGF